MSHCVVCSTDKRPVEATQGLLCFRCSNRILRWLRELEEYLPTLSAERSPSGTEPVSGPGFGSRSPANDTVIMHTDPRSGWDELDGYGAAAVLTSWAALVAEERQFAQRNRHVTDSAAILRRNHDWITAQPWVDEYAGELRQVHAAVRALAHDPVPRSVGRCISMDKRGRECGGDVYEKVNDEAVQCSSCNRIYDGLSLVRLKAAWEAS